MHISSGFWIQHLSLKCNNQRIIICITKYFDVKLECLWCYDKQTALCWNNLEPAIQQIVIPQWKRDIQSNWIMYISLALLASWREAMWATKEAKSTKQAFLVLRWLCFCPTQIVRHLSPSFPSSLYMPLNGAMLQVQQCC